MGPNVWRGHRLIPTPAERVTRDRNGPRALAAEQTDSFLCPMCLSTKLADAKVLQPMRTIAERRGS